MIKKIRKKRKRKKKRKKRKKKRRKKRRKNQNLWSIRRAESTITKIKTGINLKTTQDKS